jgi:hypothetical protein
MANSLRAKIKKLRHNGNITVAEYHELIKKLDGHDREARNKTIDEFAEKMKWEYENSIGVPKREIDFAIAVVELVAEQLKKEVQL